MAISRQSPGQLPSGGYNPKIYSYEVIYGGVSVRGLKNSLSEYLRRVQEGEEIVVVSRKYPVARLTPVSSVRNTLRSTLHQQLRGASEVFWNGEKPKLRDKPVKLRGRGQTALEIVVENRD